MIMIGIAELASIQPAVEYDNDCIVVKSVGMLVCERCNKLKH